MKSVIFTLVLVATTFSAGASHANEVLKFTHRVNFFGNSGMETLAQPVAAEIELIAVTSPDPSAQIWRGSAEIPMEGTDLKLKVEVEKAIAECEPFVARPLCGTGRPIYNVASHINGKVSFTASADNLKYLSMSGGADNVKHDSLGRAQAWVTLTFEN